MIKIDTRQITLTALFLALCIIVPIVFHMLGAGAIFLPMFLPILVAALILRYPYGLIVGTLGPLISSLTTGMPVLFPMAIFMSVEGLTMTFVAGYLYRSRKFSVLLSIAIALTIDRIILFFMVILVVPLLGLPPKMFSLLSILYSLPGVVLQLIVVPIIISALRHTKSINLE
ncbi:ECF transporter S component [candidate division KSB1 bacterium]|nr:ECF transporter S component [candidate division KSB1 bacterium]